MILVKKQHSLRLKPKKKKKKHLATLACNLLEMQKEWCLRLLSSPAPEEETSSACCLNEERGRLLQCVRCGGERTEEKTQSRAEEREET